MSFLTKEEAVLVTQHERVSSKSKYNMYFVRLNANKVKCRDNECKDEFTVPEKLAPARQSYAIIYLNVTT
jgi:hypothetical protein